MHPTVRTTLACAAALAMLALAPARAFAQCKNDPSINPAQTNDAAPGAPIDLTAQGANGNDVGYVWTQTAGEPGVLTPKNNPRGATFVVPTVTSSSQAAITIQVTVTNCGLTRTATALINVRVANQPPTAVAKVAPAVVGEGGTFALDGGDSSDPENGALTYQWEQLDHLADYPIAGLPTGGATVASLVAPAEVPPAGAAITFQLTVTDPGGLKSTDRQTVTVSWVNDPPIARPKVIVFDAAGDPHASACPFPEGSPVVVNEGEDFVLDGSASTDDDGIAPRGTYTWSQATGGPSIPGGLPPASTIAAVSLTAPGLTALLGDTMEFQLQVTDDLGLASALSPRCVVKVHDVTPPEITVPDNLTPEATGPGGTAVTYSASALDNFDGPLTPTCSPASGSTFALDEPTAVACSATDAAGNSATRSFTVTVRDTTGPAVSVPADFSVEATSGAGAVVTFATSASDLVDGPSTPSCSKTSGETFPLGATTVTCTATDARGNPGTSSFVVSVVDTTPPVLTVPADITTLPTVITGKAVVEYSVSATDLVDANVSVACTPPSGSEFGPNATTTVSCTATDDSGNGTTRTFQVIVKPFVFAGFFAPVDMDKLNTVKGGSTVPFKWTMADAHGAVTSTAVVSEVKAAAFPCTALSGSLEAAIEYTATGGTALRYDTTARQFILNWQTPKAPGACYQLFVVFTDGTNQSAVFKLK